MPAKNVNLAEVFKATEEKRTPTPDARASEKGPPARKNKKHIGGYFDEAVYRQVKIIGAEQGLTTQDILTQALNAFFERHAKPPIA